MNTCHACGAEGRTYPARRIVRSGRNRAAEVQTQFCRACVQSLCGIRFEWEPLSMAELKAQWLAEYGKEKVYLVFDDRSSVVEMWRAQGLPCFQVAPGNF